MDFKDKIKEGKLNTHRAEQLQPLSLEQSWSYAQAHHITSLIRFGKWIYFLLYVLLCIQQPSHSANTTSHDQNLLFGKYCKNVLIVERISYELTKIVLH